VRVADLFTGRATAAFTLPAAPRPDPVAVIGTAPIGVLPRMITDAATANRAVALSVPAVRKARHVIAGTISTFILSGWAGQSRLPADDPRVAWLRQPDPAATLQSMLFRTIDDGIWYDRAVWQILDRNVASMPVKFRRVAPARISTVPNALDPDQVDTWIVDGREITNPARQLVVFDFAGLGGLKRWGVELLDLYLDLQAAAGRYARAPHPMAVLKNHGADLTAPQISALLDEWEAARETRATGYLNDVVDYDTFGWNASELQLTEAREHAALETARMFGLPARAVDASGGDSMTYANVAESRRDILEALRPWMTVVDQTLSLDDRASRPTGLFLPSGITARLDVDAYTRDAPGDRMTTWETALRAGVLSIEEVRAAEPLATTATAPNPPAPADVPTPAPAPTLEVPA
jgi:HK97 family phage portal protein